jgi:hypothetical protein
MRVPDCAIPAVVEDGELDPFDATVGPGYPWSAEPPDAKQCIWTRSPGAGRFRCPTPSR